MREGREGGEKEGGVSEYPNSCVVCAMLCLNSLAGEGYITLSMVCSNTHGTPSPWMAGAVAAVTD